MLQAIIGVLVGIGLFLVLMDLFKIPYSKTSQAVDNISKKQKNKASFLEVRLEGLAKWISKFIRINEFKRAQLEADLKTAQMDISPEMFKANAISVEQFKEQLAQVKNDVSVSRASLLQ